MQQQPQVCGELQNQDIVAEHTFNIQDKNNQISFTITLIGVKSHLHVKDLRKAIGSNRGLSFGHILLTNREGIVLQDTMKLVQSLHNTNTAYMNYLGPRHCGTPIPGGATIGIAANNVTPVDIYSNIPSSNSFIPSPAFPGMNPNAPKNTIVISSNQNANTAFLVRTLFENAALQRTLQLAVQSNQKIADLKKRLTSLVPDPESNFKLIYNEKELDEQTTFSEIGYKDGTKVQVVTTSTEEDTNNHNGEEVVVSQDPNPTNGNASNQSPPEDNSPPKAVIITIIEESSMKSLFFLKDTNTIDELKKQWYDRRAQGSTEQSIVFYKENTPIQNTASTFRQLGISGKADLNLKFESDSSIKQELTQSGSSGSSKVQIRLIDTSIQELNCELSNTKLSVFKLLVSSVTNMEASRFNLIFNGNLLNDSQNDKTMSELGVKPNDIIHFFEISK